MRGNGPAPSHSVVYQFAGYTLDPGRLELIGPDGEEATFTRKVQPKFGGKKVVVEYKLGGRCFDLLFYLVLNPEKFIHPRELIEVIWQDANVYPEVVTQCVSTIRSALKEAPGIVRNKYGRGYMLDARVSRGRPSTVEPLPQPDDDRRDSVRLSRGRPSTVEPLPQPDDDRCDLVQLSRGRPSTVEPLPQPDDDRRDLVRLCVKWCGLIWLPQRIFDGLFYTREWFDDRDLQDVALLTLTATKQQEVVDASTGDALSGQDPLTPEMALRNLVTLLRRHRRTGMNLVRHHAFDVIARNFGKPRRMIYDVTTFMYPSASTNLIRFRDEMFTFDEGIVSRYNMSVEKIINTHFLHGATWSWRDMRQAHAQEAMHIRVVVKELLQDIAVPADAGFLEAREDLFRHDRRDEAGHPIARAVCAAVLRLVAGIEPVVEAHVPACFPLDLRDGEPR